VSISGTDITGRGDLTVEQRQERQSVRAQEHMTHDEIREELLRHVPESAGLIDLWDNTALKQLHLTSVGLAIGHGYWRRATEIDAPLGIWLGDTTQTPAVE
jgi:hypothetical protein